jgi:hypothetical protein
MPMTQSLRSKRKGLAELKDPQGYSGLYLPTRRCSSSEGVGGYPEESCNQSLMLPVSSAGSGDKGTARAEMPGTGRTTK